MLIVYNGPHPEVVVDEIDQDTVIKTGVPVEIPNDLAARLLEQSTWSQAKSAPISTPSVVSSTPSDGDDTTKVSS